MGEDVEKDTKEKRCERKKEKKTQKKKRRIKTPHPCRKLRDYDAGMA